MKAALSRTLLSLLFFHATKAEKPISGVPYSLGRQSLGSNAVDRIEYMSVTVDDVSKALTFYRDILGGKEVPLCHDGGRGEAFCTEDGFVRMAGDDVDAALFTIERREGVQVPDLSAGGNFEGHAAFVLLGNSLIQLIAFVDRTTHEPFVLPEPRTSPVWMGQAHMDLWVEGGVDANLFIKEVEERAEEAGIPEVKFNRPVPQESLSDREKVPVERLANKVEGGAFDGLSWAYFKGPVGEQLEIYEIEGEMRKSVGKAFCMRGAVCSDFVTSSSEGETAAEKFLQKKDEKPISQRVVGMFQYGYRTADLHRAVAFYSEVLGGDLISYPTQGIEIMQDDSAHWMILGNETLQAFAYAEKEKVPLKDAMEAFAVPDLRKEGGCRLDHRFVLFDNFVVEPLQYTNGLSFGGKGYDPVLDHPSSLAYLGTVTGAFSVPPGLTLETYVPFLTSRLGGMGVEGVKLPPAQAEFPPAHPLGGLKVAYAKGPDGEAIAFVEIIKGGRFEASLHSSLVDNNGVSTRFPDTNVFLKGGMDSFCESVGVPRTPTGSRNSEAGESLRVTEL